MGHHDWKVGFVLLRGTHYSKHLQGAQWLSGNKQNAYIKK